MTVLPLLLAASAVALDLPAPSAVLAQARAAADRPTLEGTFPEGAFRDREEHVAAIWEFVKALGGAPAGIRPPVIHFSVFDPAVQDPAWTAWQRSWSLGQTQIWTDYLCNAVGKKKFPQVEAERLCETPGRIEAFLAAHPEVREEYPYPAQFRAFHYDGTNRIQINPETTYMAFYQNGPDGLPRDYTGYGYYVTGHELLHYALEQRGVPPLTHHCLFVTKGPDGTSYMEKLAAFIAQRGIGTEFALRRYGVAAEESFDPCGARRP
ncbi:MAG: hypothetical protein SF051_09280 [Elusimicrobiota bacterium]|nr:hypothetical protein [Elusimicrobiota bacterium]